MSNRERFRAAFESQLDDVSVEQLKRQTAAAAYVMQAAMRALVSLGVNPRPKAVGEYMLGCACAHLFRAGVEPEQVCDLVRAFHDTEERREEVAQNAAVVIASENEPET